MESNVLRAVSGERGIMAGLNGGRVTLSEIAKRAKTNTTAVSVVLNGARSNTRVSEETRGRIREIAAELNYSPNALAQGLKRQRANTIGVLFNWAGAYTLNNLFSVAILDGVVAGAASAGYRVLLYTEAWHTAETSAAAFSDSRADGVIVVAPGDHSDVISGLTNAGVPVALLSSVTDLPSVPYSNGDNRQGVALALEHLTSLGHTRIAYISHCLDRYNMRDRCGRFREWMSAHGLKLPDDYVLSLHRMEGAGTNRTQIDALLRLPEPPTAILASNDDIATEVLDAARHAGIVVPDQLSVVGFDDVLIASLTVPKLTTIRQPLFEMGQQAVLLLAARIEAGIEAKGGLSLDGPAASYIGAPELIIRASTSIAPTSPA